MQTMWKLLKDNSLTIAMTALFVVCFAGHSVASWRVQSGENAAHGRAVVSYWQNLISSSYLEELSSNWQAAFLQLTSLIIFSVVLYQRGAPHSRNPDKRKDKRKEAAENARFPWLYRHSLSVTFVAMFLVTFVIHIISGALAWNNQLQLMHKPAISIGAFLISAKFWSATLETWQAEYMTIAIFIVLSIFLRQQDSAESKPMDDTDNDTGKAND